MRRAPRVLFVTHNVPRFDGDAAGSFVLRLAVGLQALGARVQIIAPGAAGISATSTLEGVPIERVRYASDDRMTLAYTGNMAETVRGSWSGRVALLQLLFATRRAVRRALAGAQRDSDPFDIVHIHWWFPSGLALWKLFGRNDPARVVTMHGSDVRLAAHTKPAHPVMRAVLGEAAACTAVSSWLATTARAIAPAREITVAPMPIDDRLFDATTNAADRRDLLFVGRLNAQKGLADLLAALATTPLVDTTLHVVGDGPDRAALEQQAHAARISQRVVWHGALPQQALAPLYARARAVVIPSRGEGLGLVAVEAQLCGTPVVAYADGGLLDVVRPEHGGTLVEPGDVSALATAIALVIATDSSVEQRGTAARRDVMARFTPRAVAERYLGIYADAGDPASAGDRR
jgi:glycosyltransferase involved in cell wall biosynthesis